MLQYCYRGACAIHLGQTVIITGGYGNMKKVSQYNEDGQHTELPELITRRYLHGCSSYIDSDNNIVKVLLNSDSGCNIVLTRFCW